MKEAEIRRIISDEIAAVEEQIAGYKELIKPIAPDNAIGRITRMDAINNRSINEAALRQAEKKLSGLKDVLSQCGTASFGICPKCGGRIPVERMLYIPESRYCVHCA